MTHKQKEWLSWLLVLFALLIVVCMFCRCATPPPLIEAEKASIDSLRNYHENANTAVDELVKAYRASSIETLDLLFEIDLKDSTSTVDALLSVPQPNRAGNVSIKEIEIKTLQYVDPDAVLGLLQIYKEKLAEIDKEASDFEAAWKKANQDYANAVELREQVYRWLTRPAIGPDEIDAVGRALSDEIRRTNQ